MSDYSVDKIKYTFFLLIKYQQHEIEYLHHSDVKRL